MRDLNRRATALALLALIVAAGCSSGSRTSSTPAAPAATNPGGGGGSTGGGGGGGATTPTNTPPSATVVTPPSPASGDVFIDYTLTDAESDPAGIVASYSLDGGIVFRPASRGPGGSATSNLATSPAGVGHRFVWDSFGDLGTIAVAVVFRIQPADAALGGPALTSSFVVDNRSAGNTPPTVSLIAPPNATIVSGDVSVGYTLVDADSDVCRVVVEYETITTGGFVPATAGPGSDPTSGLATSPQGRDYRFVWRTGTDIGPNAAAGVRIRVTAFDPSGPGATATSPYFGIDNTVPTSPAAPTIFSLTPDRAARGGTVRIDGTGFGPTAGDNDVRFGTVAAPVAFASTGRLIVSTPGGAPIGLTSVTVTVGGLSSNPVPFEVVNDPVLMTLIPSTARVGETVRILGQYFSTEPDGVVVRFSGGVSVIATAGISTEVSATVPAGARTGSITVLTNGATSNSLPFTVAPTVTNTAPSIGSLGQPTGTQRGVVPVPYTLVDAEADTCSVRVEYSTDGGATFSAATASAAGDPVAGLAASSGGTSYTFAWDSVADVGATVINALIRMTPSDGQLAGRPVATAPFVVDNAPVTPPPTTNTPPRILSLETPTGDQQGFVAVRYEIADDESDVSSVRVEFSRDGGATWQPAAINAVTGDPTTGLATSSTPTSYVSFWGSLADLGAVDEPNCRLRVTPNDGRVDGATVATGTFAVINAVFGGGGGGGGTTPPAGLSITSVSPREGTVMGETLLTIGGSGFDASTAVRVGGNALVDLVVVSPTMIQGRTIRVAVPRTDDVTVSNAAGADTLVGGYTYVSESAASIGIASVSPDSAPRLTPTLITITGRGFDRNSEVFIGGNRAGNVVVIDATTIRCETPITSRTGAQHLEVRNDRGLARLTFGFTYR